MNKTILSLLLTYSSLSLAQILTDKEELDHIEVIGHENSQQNIVKLLPENAQSIIDTPEVLKKIPGANVNRNGPLSGIAQYRGLFGNRVNVQIDNITMQE
ncbi:MAG TPA: TonB-dependent receptor, partial [Gammaproteobacteria bacterium]|nr:TonB-dependent receptor [Gammaproteobacteria bacterium]